ncbi:hypothetical protein QJQ45_019244, partial [Haematococcus lacustris]
AERMGNAEDTRPRSFVFTKSKAKVRIDAGGVEEQQEHRQLIVGLQGSVVQPANLEAGTAPKRTVPTIAPLANTFKTGVGNKFTPSFRPPSSDAAAAGDPNEKFELAAVDSRPLITEFGLAKRTKPGSNGQNTTEQTSELAARRVKGSTELELLAFKRDMEQLPDAAGEQAYENMPIADFGRAMLMGMGWHEGMGVGRNRKAAEPIEYLRRPDRLGLGAKPVPVVNDGKPKVVKMGDKAEVQRQDLVLPPSANGRQRHVRHLDEQLVQRSETEPGPRPGKAMRVTGGKHAGLACQVIALLPQREGHSCECYFNRRVVMIASLQLSSSLPAPSTHTPALAMPRTCRDMCCGLLPAYSLPGCVPWTCPGRASVKLMPSHELVEVRCKDLDEPHSNQQQQQQARDKRPVTHGAFPAAEHRSAGQVLAEPPDKGKAGQSKGMQGRDGEDCESREAREGSQRPDSSKAHRHSSHHDRGGTGSRTIGQGREKRARSDCSSDSESEEAAAGARMWLTSFIKVRIIDKKLGGGKLYLKKGTVVDVHPGGRCDVSVDDTQHVLHVKQSALETVVPRDVGASVLIVSGPLRGNKARLHAKSAGGAAAVQLVSDFSVHHLMLDDIAMFVGSMEDE